MRKNDITQRVLLLALTVLIALGTQVATAEPAPSTALTYEDQQPGRPKNVSDVFDHTGHHAIFDRTGRRLDPSLETLHNWVEYTFRDALESAKLDTRQRLRDVEKRAREVMEIDDTVLKSLLLEWLVFQDKRKDRIYIQAMNRVVREHWFRKRTDFDRFIKIFDFRTGLPAGLGKTAIALNLLPDEAGDQTGEPYMRTCEEAGVPVPPKWSRMSGDWSKEGILIRNFLSLGPFTEVWTFENDKPDGICVALPRFDENPEEVDGARASAVGIICLGRESGNACFYDTGAIRANEERDIINFVSGSTLSNGVCSDCHAGENPYIVHPGGPLDMGSRIRSPMWHNPIIRSDWPQNPGPLTLLGAVSLLPNEGSCLDCHNTGFAGRFPDVMALTEHKRVRTGNPSAVASYCTSVLSRAIEGYLETFSGDQVAPTMVRIPDPADPSNIRKGTPDPDYETHRQAMLAFCQQTPPTPPSTVPVDPEDDREVISPPVLGPLYACAESVEVRGAVYDAEVVLTINSSDLPPVIAKSSDGFDIKVSPLVAGDMVSVRQTDAGVTVASDEYEVISHLEHYPDGLPRPKIDPTVVHQCGRVIAIRHAPGAFVTILSNGGMPVTYTSGGDWTNMRPGKFPFDDTDEFIAEQRICMDTSDPSTMVTAGPEPSPLPTPMIKDGAPISGQPYLHLVDLPEGAKTRVGEASAGSLTNFSTAVNWNPEVDVASGLGRLIQPGDSFQVTSELCKAVEVRLEEAQPCESLPAPTIAQPFVGDTTVTVTNFVAGARVQVFDAGPNEIADASGSEIGLTRPLVQGDVLTVIQRIGNCVSREGYRITAVCASIDKCG